MREEIILELQYCFEEFKALDYLVNKKISPKDYCDNINKTINIDVPKIYKSNGYKYKEIFENIDKLIVEYNPMIYNLQFYSPKLTEKLIGNVTDKEVLSDIIYERYFKIFEEENKFMDNRKILNILSNYKTYNSSNLFLLFLTTINIYLNFENKLPFNELDKSLRMFQNYYRLPFKPNSMQYRQVERMLRTEKSDENIKFLKYLLNR